MKPEIHDGELEKQGGGKKIERIGGTDKSHVKIHLCIDESFRFEGVQTIMKGKLALARYAGAGKHVYIGHKQNDEDYDRFKDRILSESLRRLRDIAYDSHSAVGDDENQGNQQFPAQLEDEPAG